MTTNPPDPTTLYAAIAPLAIAAARRVAPRWLGHDPDFLQDIRLRAWRSALHVAQRYTHDLAPFAATIGRNAARGHLRCRRPLGFRESVVHRARTPRIVSHGDLEALGRTVARIAPDPFAADALEALCDRARLTPIERESILLGFTIDLTHAEIAARLGLTVRQAERRRVTANAKIRGALSRS